MTGGKEEGKTTDKKSFTVPVHQLEEWEEERKKIDESRGNKKYTFSAYVRDHVEAGRTQLDALANTDETGLEKKVHEKLPENPEEAREGEEIVEEILEDDRERIWEILDKSDSIATSRGRYYRR